jgi:hypothetical protein
VLLECAGQVPTDGPAAARLATVLRTAAGRLEEPMRLAVVGQLKRGKSTLVNALLRAEVVATARRELTFNVNELCHAETEEVTVHFRDGREPRRVPPTELDRWTTYDQAHLADLQQVRKVEFGLPNDLLQRFRLVDTPGLGSIRGSDSAAALAHLGLDAMADRDESMPMLALLSRDAGTVHRESLEEFDQADAVLYLFSRGIHRHDRAAMSAFAGVMPGALTPLRAFGVLSKCDAYWPPDPDQAGGRDPLTYHPLRDGAARVVAGHLDEPEMSRLFYTIKPVAARVAIGAYGLDDEQLTWLADLSHTDPRRLGAELSDEAFFVARDALPIPATARRTLMRRLGPWGIHLACSALRDGLDEDRLRAHLAAESGVEELRDLVIRHFGNRTTLIKLYQAVRSVRSALAEVPAGASPDLRRSVDLIGRRIEELERSEHGFAELAALSDYYRGRLADFSDRELTQLLEVTGERGTHCASRLGLSPHDTALQTMAATAADRVRYWAMRSNDPLLERRSREAARTMLRSYDRISHRIRLARELLEMAD